MLIQLCSVYAGDKIPSSVFFSGIDSTGSGQVISGKYGRAIGTSQKWPQVCFANNNAR